MEHHQRRLDRLQNCPIGSSPSNCGRVLARFYFGDCLQNVKDQLQFPFVSFILIYRLGSWKWKKRNVFLEIIFSLTRIVSSVFSLLVRIHGCCYYYSVLLLFKFAYIFSYFYRETYNSKLTMKKYIYYYNLILIKTNVTNWCYWFLWK